MAVVNAHSVFSCLPGHSKPKFISFVLSLSKQLLAAGSKS
jgi:hypothetical protein